MFINLCVCSNNFTVKQWIISTLAENRLQAKCKFPVVIGSFSYSIIARRCLRNNAGYLHCYLFICYNYNSVFPSWTTHTIVVNNCAAFSINKNSPFSRSTKSYYFEKKIRMCNSLQWRLLSFALLMKENNNKLTSQTVNTELHKFLVNNIFNWILFPFVFAWLSLFYARYIYALILHLI